MHQDLGPEGLSADMLARLDVDYRRLGPLPIVNHFLARLGVDYLLDEYIPSDPRAALAPAIPLGVLIRNLVLAREPVYAVGRWAARYDPSLLALSGESIDLTDDRVGRALDRLFHADRATLLTRLMMRTVEAFKIDLSELHNDSTSIKLHGSYRQAVGRRRGDKRAAAICFGYSTDHRPDLRQLVWILTVSADGAVPICYRLADGNTNDATTHIDTWKHLCELVGSVGFCYVADCKLCTREQMCHIHRNGGRFVTVLPRNRREDADFRDWIVTHEPPWVEVARKPGQHHGDPDQVWWAAPAPWPTAEGFRVVWLRSSVKQDRDGLARQAAIRKGVIALEKLNETLKSARCQLRTGEKVEEAAHAALGAASSDRYIAVTVGKRTVHEDRQVGPGRPGLHTVYRRVTKTHFDLSWEVRNDVVQRDAASDGCWPLVTNDEVMTLAEVFNVYHWQPNLETRHHLLKGPLAVAPVFLKSEFRMEGLACCLYVALLTHALIERQLRRAMAEARIPSLPIYPESRSCAAPTTTQVLDLFADVGRIEVTLGDAVVKRMPVDLSPLQRQLLELLDVPVSAYEAWPEGS